LPCKSRFTLAEAAVEEVEVVVLVPVVVVELHAREADSLPRQLPRVRPLLARPLRSRPLARVLEALRLPPGLQVVRPPLPGPPAALQPGRLRKAALAQALVRLDKVLPLLSVRAALVQMSPAAVPRQARLVTSLMFPVPRPVQSRQQVRDVPVALPPIFCKVVEQPSSPPPAPVTGKSVREQRSALARRLSLRALAAPVRLRSLPVLDDQALLTRAAPAPAARTSLKIGRSEPRIGSSHNRTVNNGGTK